MRFELYQEVALTRDVPDANLRVGDVASLIDHVPHPSGGEEGAVLDNFNALEESFAVVTVPASSIASLGADQVPTVRTLASS